MHVKSLMDVLNEVVIGHKDKLRECLNSTGKDVEHEVARYTNLVSLIARAYPTTMLETLDYLISYPDSKLFDIVVPLILESDVLHSADKLPPETSVIIDKALQRGYRDRYFVSARFFNLLSTKSKIKAIKFLLRSKAVQEVFAESNIVLHIGYEVFKKIQPQAFNKLSQCLPLFKFDDKSLRALAAYALDSEAKCIRGYLRYAPYFERCVRCYKGVPGSFECNDKLDFLTTFTPPEVCPKNIKEELN